MDHGGSSRDKPLQCRTVVQVTLNQSDALAGQVLCPPGCSGQSPYEIALLLQPGTQCGADKPRRAGDGDQAAAWDQADATLRRNSSVTAFRLSASCVLIKSRRALARDNLPEEVLGSAWGGTSST